MLLTVAIVALIGSFNLGAFLSPYDGGITASAATFNLHGLFPYRDYWLLYGPLSGIVVAFPTFVFGPSIELLRVVGLILLTVEAVVAFRLANVWAAPAPAVALSVSAVVLLPAMLGLDASAWMVAMTLALLAVYLSVGTRRSGLLVGILVGVAFLSRLDVGAYALAGTLVVRDRRAVLAGFSLVAVPFVALLLASTPPATLIEQLLWYPLVGTRQFRGLTGSDGWLGQPAALLLAVPLILVPRLAIALAAMRLIRVAVRGTWSAESTTLLGLVVFASACQLQTLGRADFEHFAQAGAPAILLLSVWFPVARPRAFRFTMLSTAVAACVVVGLVGSRLHADTTAYDQNLRSASSWIRSATSPQDRVFVGLTTHRYTVLNPLIVYYLADRGPAVHDTMFNPGVTNTDWGQTRMIADLERSNAPYLVLDRALAEHRETSADGGAPGSTLLDEYLHKNYRTVCDLGTLVIQARTDESASPACPSAAP